MMQLRRQQRNAMIRAAPAFGAGALAYGGAGQVIDLAKMAHQYLGSPKRKAKAAAKRESKAMGRPPPGKGPIIVAPVSTAREYKTKAARMQAQGKGTFRVTHREHLGEVKSTGGTDVYTYRVNAGLLPWLASMANAWDYYSFKKLKFSFEPAVATSAVGNLYLAFDGPMKDNLPTTPAEVMTLEGAGVNRIWTPTAFNVPHKHLTRKRLVRDHPLAGKKAADYDVGNFIYACSGAAVSTIGALYVDYTVEFSTPSTNVPISHSKGATQAYVLSNHALTTTVDYDVDVKASAAVSGFDGLELTPQATATGYMLPPGSYSIEVINVFRLSSAAVLAQLTSSIAVDGAVTYSVPTNIENGTGADKYIPLATTRLIHLEDTQLVSARTSSTFAAGTVHIYSSMITIQALR